MAGRSLEGIAARFSGGHSFRSLAKNPLAHIGRALNQFNALIFTANQKSNHPEVHQGDFAQVEDFTLAAITQVRSYAREIIRLNPAAQPQPDHAATAIFFNL